MPQLIKDSQIADNRWRLLSEQDCEQALPEGKIILPLSVWQKKSAELNNADDVGVWIEGDTDLKDIGASLTKAPIIAVKFPGFMDGRGFSTGRLLRERYQFKGELRAVGHIIRDQLCYLRRCGFSAFQLMESEELETALESLNDFSEYYQSSVDEPVPLFRRRTQ